MCMFLYVLTLLLPLSTLTHHTTYPTPRGGVISHHTSWKEDQLSDLAEYIHYGLRWKFYFTDDGINWQLNFNDVLVSPLVDDIAVLLGLDREKLGYQNATGRILRRGDDVKINRICKTPDEQGTVAILVLAVPPDKNDYGEIMFFDDVIGDVIAAIRPSDFSLISFPCWQAYQWQYPAVQTQKGLVFIQFVFREREEERQEVMSNVQDPFPVQSGVTEETIDIDIKITRSFNLTDSKPVFVIDNLFETGTLEELASHFLSSLYIYNEQDDEGYSDNVVFITPQLTYQLTRSRVWATLSRVMTHVTGRRGWYPYDVSNNLNKAWDHTRIHPDCFGREEYTMLLYLNPGYGPGDLGGTVWYTDEDGAQILGSVMNKYGRLAVFHCSIPHSARPPHAYITQPRLTFAVKVTNSRAGAVVRGMSEASFNMEGEEEDMEQVAAEQAAELQLWNKLKHEYSGNVALLEEEFQGMVEQFLRDSEQELENALVTAGSGGRRSRDEL